MGDFTARGLRKASRVSAFHLSQVQRRANNFEKRLSRRIDGPRLAREFLGGEYPRIRPMSLSNAVTRSPAVRVLGFLGGGVFGGMSTALMLGAALAEELDLPLEVVQTHAFDADVDFGAHIRKAGFAVPANRCSTVDISRRHIAEEAILEVHPADVFVVSAWWDAHLLQRT